jgi:hypothetical protein
MPKTKNISKETYARNWWSNRQSGGKIGLETVLQNIISSSPYEADKLYLKI